ncbi:hypothetical protein Bbelb_250550 [Branchiostoma belcheri]|nr:hypothetical protein Bbelb_250550 [Branchiostoma belcheri]
MDGDSPFPRIQSGLLTFPWHQFRFGCDFESAAGENGVPRAREITVRRAAAPEREEAGVTNHMPAEDAVMTVIVPPESVYRRARPVLVCSAEGLPDSVQRLEQHADRSLQGRLRTGYSITLHGAFAWDVHDQASG